MSSRMKKTFSQEMRNLDAAGLLREENIVTKSNSMELQMDSGGSLINFIDNDFLGWQFNDEVRRSASEACSRYGAGSTCSRATVGTQDLIKDLEEKLANFLSAEDCIVFPSSYAAYMAIFEPLTNHKDKIIIDELCSPGLLDGTQLSSARLVPYLHNDDESLEYHLKCSQSSRFRLIVTDGVFATTGQCAKLQQIEALKSTYDAICLVDDSLGLGILGASGRGTHSHLEINQQSDLVSGSFGYALGNVGGGFVAGSNELISWLKNTSRPYILSEPLSAVNAASVSKVIDMLQSGGSAVDQLMANAAHAKDGLSQLDIKMIENGHAIICVEVGSAMNAQKMVEFMFSKGLLVSGLCYPNTPEDESIIRMNLTANHSQGQIDEMVSAVDQGLKQFK